jgi:hypothetical protein
MSTQAPVRHRTFAITLLAILSVIAGLLAVWDTLQYFGWAPYTLGNRQFYGGVNWLGGILSIIVALIWFSVAGQLWNLNPQGWLFVVVISVFYLIMLLLAWLGQSSWEAVAPGIIVSGLALILGLLPSTKAAFGVK